MAKKKIKTNKYKRKIVWVETDVYARRYKRLDFYIKRVFKDESNYQELVHRLENENPGIFDTPFGALYGKRNDKQAVLRLVYSHAKEIQNQMADEHLTHDQTLKKLLNTRTFVSQEELIKNNVKSFLLKRANIGFKHALQNLLGDTKIPYDSLWYNDKAHIENPDGTVEKDPIKAYVFGDTGIALVMRGSGSNASPYVFEIKVIKTA